MITNHFWCVSDCTTLGKPTSVIFHRFSNNPQAESLIRVKIVAGQMLQDFHFCTLHFDPLQKPKIVFNQWIIL